MSVSTGEWIGIGIGAAVLIIIIGYLIYKHAKKQPSTDSEASPVAPRAAISAPKPRRKSKEKKVSKKKAKK